MSKLPSARYISSLKSLTDTRKNPLTTALNLGTGVKITDVEMWQKEREAIDRQAEVLKGLGGKTIETTYLPKWAKERLNESELERAETAKKIISETQKASRARAKAAEVMARSLESSESE